MKYFNTSILLFFLCFPVQQGYSQFVLPFGDITPEQLSNKPYKPDPGADAIVLSDIAVAKLGYDNEEFYVMMERDVRIRIVNSGGFDKADIEIAFPADDRMSDYKASTFNIKNGEKTETSIPPKSFIIEKTSQAYRSLKFNFPDVHEGSVIEYSYRIKLNNSSVYVLVPWAFQREIPIVLSSLTVEYPDAFRYKYFLSGSSENIKSEIATSNSQFLGDYLKMNTLRWTAKDVPAFRDEPYILGRREHVTKLTFELAKVDYPDMASMEITPSYATLAEKLHERTDFGTQLNTNLKSLTKEVIGSETDNLLKLKKIHNYITSNIFWNGDEDFTASSSLRKVLNKEKGNSADINMILIAMARAADISAEPVILSTRSHGSLNTISAMFQQFNYLVARISAGGDVFLVDATDPLRPFNMLPFTCLNKTGRLISETESEFVDLKNDEKYHISQNLTLNPDGEGNIKGTLRNIYSGYSAYNVRSVVKLESEEGYLDIIRTAHSNAIISDFKLTDLNNPDKDLAESFNFTVDNGSQIAGNEIIMNPFQLGTSITNPFYAIERKFPIDFGCPQEENFEMTLTIPDGYQVADSPENLKLDLGKDGGSFVFSCQQSGNSLIIKSELSIDKVLFPQTEYKEIQKFFLRVQEKQAEYIILKKS